MFFNLKILLGQANNNPLIIVKMLENYFYRRVPKSRRDLKYFSKASLKGDSFILHPERLFINKADVTHKAQYIILAAKRDYLFYQAYGVEYLDLTYFPDLNLEKIRGNPLIKIEDNKLHFKT